MKDADNGQKQTGLYQTQALSAGDFESRSVVAKQEDSATGSFLPGDIIDKDYQLQAIIGRGGMGVVFSCRHLVLKRDYALKILTGRNLDEAAWSRFKLEAKALARLNHPGIVRIHNMGVHEGSSPYYVMDLLTGETLDQLIQRNSTLKTEDALRLFIDVADALNSAHLNGVIHRDIKPSNMMLLRDSQGRPETLKIVDFGIARIAQKDFDQQSQTATGLVFGTPYYMSPEQCMGAKTDKRSDIYSFGCSLFEALTGALPFQGINAFETFLLHQSAPAPTLASKAVDGRKFAPDLEDALAKMLAKNVNHRYQSMSQLKHDLERIAEGKPIMIAARDQSNPDSPTVKSIKAGHGEGSKTFSQQQKLLAALAGVTLGVMATVGIIYFNPLGTRDIKTYSSKRIALERKALPANLNKTEDLTKQFIADSLPGSNQLVDRLDSSNRKAGQTVSNEQAQEDAGEIMQSLPMLMKKPSELKALGYTEKDIREVSQFDFRELGERVQIFRHRLENFLPVRTATGARFMTRSGESYFLFPRDISIGGIRIGDKPAVRAVGIIAAPKGVDKVITFESATEDFPKLLDQFGPDDLTGLELRWKKPESALSKIEHWHNVKEICLFNPLLKVAPGMEFLDECLVKPEILPTLAKFPKLQTLGLAGPVLSNENILKMPVLPRLVCLKLKSIANIDPLLSKLKNFDNLHELWLVREDTTTEQLEPLTQMKNLERLTIRLSLLQPSSLSVFKRMKHLRSLTLDRNWTYKERQRFASELPNCKVAFEPCVDRTFWNLLK